MGELPPPHPVQFGKYRLLRKIAVGGMAEIYLAKSVGVAGFEKTIIVKRILPELTSRQRFVRMFVNEAKVSSLLTHSNVVQVFDFGRIGSDYFIAMELVDGKDLRSITRAVRERGARISTEVVLFIAAQILRALEYAHGHHVVHRDVSPQNILVSWEGEVKLADFGIAKVEQWTSLTRAGEVKGNFGYMAPEQAGASRVGPPADLYAVGVVLYELLTQHNPFSEGDLPQIIRRIREHRPPAPSHFNANVSAGLDAVVMKAMAKRPSERFPTATSMLSAVTGLLYPTSTNLSSQMAAFMTTLFESSSAAPTPPERVFAVRPSFVKTKVEPTTGVTKVRDHSSLGRLRLYVAPRVVEVFIDDHLLHTGAPVEIQTSAHVEHELALRAHGFDDFRTAFTLRAGEVRNLSIVLAGS